MITYLLVSAMEINRGVMINCLMEPGVGRGVCDGRLSYFSIDKISWVELNLLYVAVTRAKKQLIMSPTLVGLLRRAKVSHPKVGTVGMLERHSVPFSTLGYSII